MKAFSLKLQSWTRRGIALIALSSALAPLSGWSQNDPLDGDNNDYGVLATDPLEIDQEVDESYGRYFQTTLGVGSLIFTQDLAKAYSAGYLINLKFVLYLDQVWAAEFGGGYSRSKGSYTEANTNVAGVDIHLTQTLVPFELGIRYTPDLDSLPKGLAMMNPYVSAGAGVAFRSESVTGNPNPGSLETDEANLFLKSSTRNTTGWIAQAGGGMEFDIIKGKLLAGFDARYHAVIWSDNSKFIGDLGRKGHFITILATLTHNY